MLLTSCITVADGQVNAGKNEAGELMVFHTGNILRVELRDRAGNPVEEKPPPIQSCRRDIRYGERTDQPAPLRAYPAASA